MTRIYAHRGASGYAPENTFAAFDIGLAMQADGIETDVRATSDGHLVLLHDARVDRTTDGMGLVADLTLAQCQQLDAGAWFAPSFTGERVPTVQSLLERYGHKTHFWLELKAPGVERSLAQLVQRSRHSERVQFSSFSMESLRRMRETWPEAHLTWLVSETSPLILDQAQEIRMDQLSVRGDVLSTEVVTQVCEAGMETRAWGVTDRAMLTRLLALDLYGLTLNWPDWAHAAAEGHAPR
jgi:glycerophosphoryl diester phosphodiesterase